MPRLEQWANFPKKLRQHLIQRMADRSITIDDLNQLRLSGWTPTPKFPRANGTKTSGPSRCVEKDRTRKHFSCLARQLEEYGFSRSPFMKIRHTFLARATSEDSRSASIEHRIVCSAVQAREIMSGDGNFPNGFPFDRRGSEKRIRGR